MTTTTQSFGQEAFDFIDSLDRLYTPDAILGAMHRVVSRFGFDRLVITGLLPKPGESFDDLILAEHFPVQSTLQRARLHPLRPECSPVGAFVSSL